MKTSKELAREIWKGYASTHSAMFAVDKKYRQSVLESAAALIDEYTEQKWQPIETAPKNEVILMWEDLDGWIKTGWIDDEGDVHWPHAIKPARWRPLDQPPQKEEK